MKYLKFFEESQIKWYKNGKFSNPEIIDDFEKKNNNCPFDLIYGKDGPEFKCGDRVILKKGIGTIVDCNNNVYLVCFDNNISGHSGNNNKYYNIPYGHGYWYLPCFIKLLKNI